MPCHEDISTCQTFSLTSVCWAGSWRVTVAGEIDIAAAGAMAEAATFMAGRGATDVELDLSRVTFMDCGGWASVLRAQRLLRLTGARCQVTALSPAALVVARILADEAVWSLAA